MLLQSGNTRGMKDHVENKLIEKWMKRNSSNKVTIDQVIITNDDMIEKVEESNQIIQVTKKKIIYDKSTTTSSQTCSKKSSKSIIIKRMRTNSSDELPDDLPRIKIIKNSLPLGSALPTFKKTQDNSLLKRSFPESKTEKTESILFNEPKNNLLAIEPKYNSVAEGNKYIQSRSKSDIHSKTVLSNNKSKDVYTHILDNYRFIVTPKSWSATEFVNETNIKYIVFFSTRVFEDHGILVSVMQKSLIIDKGGTINYAVYGLPVDIEGTILPEKLDDSKKLLSILHIFDKIQVCNGIGTDVGLGRKDSLIKDNCHQWRHKNCKIVVMKINQCWVCNEISSHLLQKRNYIKEKI